MHHDSVPMLPPDRTGMVLQDRYRIVRKLGEGGMGEVYEVHHEKIGKRLAIKCLHPQFSRDPKAVERFTREAHTATKVRNDHIVEVFDVGVLPDGCPYMLMEYLEGRELADVIEFEGPLAIGRVVRIVEQVCEALTAIHAQNVVHRDLKPQNILLIARKGNPDFVKILDFGVSKVGEAADNLLGSLTRTGALIGTPHYMAPEQSKGLRNTDHRADIYALGVIMYLALIGRVPFDGETLPDLIMNIMTQAPTPPTELRADIPRAFNDIVMKAFRKDPAERFNSAEELARAIAPFRNLEHQPTEADFSAAAFSTLRPIVPRTSDRPISEANEDFESISFIRAAPGGAPAPFVARLETPRAWVLGALGLAGLIAGGAYIVFGNQTNRFDAAMTSSAAETQALQMPARPARNDIPIPSAPALAQSSMEHPPEATSPLAAPSAAVERASSESKREVRVHISARPAQATITIDGKEYPNPLDTHRVRSLEPVAIDVRQPGYLSQRRIVIFDIDRNLVFDLKPVPSRIRASPRAPAKVAPSPPLPVPSPASPAPKTRRTRQLRTDF
ncbi:MAG: serine/threonine protein kinase [Myxococcales bacterium]|nr:serine/threonine protein kinase [Myxococcales bacterium]